jgi:hypothetical protein
MRLLFQARSLLRRFGRQSAARNNDRSGSRGMRSHPSRATASSPLRSPTGAVIAGADVRSVPNELRHVAGRAACGAGSDPRPGFFARIASGPALRLHSAGSHPAGPRPRLETQSARARAVLAGYGTCFSAKAAIRRVAAGTNWSGSRGIVALLVEGMLRLCSDRPTA